MIYNICGIKINSKNEKIFEDSYLYHSNDYNINLILTNLNQQHYPNVEKKHEIDAIEILENNFSFYFVMNGILLVLIDSSNSVWDVKISRNISVNAIREIVIKKVIPLYCYYTNCALPFHATAIVKNNTIFSFSGYSTAGKSTLAASFIINENYMLFSDDILNLFPVNGNIWAYRGYSKLKLRKESIEEFGVNTISCNNYSEPYQIKDIIVISNKPSDKITIKRIENPKCCILQNLFCGKFCKYNADFFDLMFEIENNITFWEFCYPRRYEDLNKVKKFLEEKMVKK